ncbi:hypothetical protein C6P40_001400 [Pichia californica]|uniref:non-specific serine/threonine protein kinase n=1 Tax=Pichia californica TaxID=460514 RepID=A0A9P6WJI6_9ASCO|nr:hypothetical protein C6P42_001572 [[Candida] californica]KAG0688106.1 hypothetical protein C6P40_001400 [[Candida] californica]
MTSRLSSASASRSLSGFLENSNPTSPIHSSKTINILQDATSPSNNKINSSSNNDRKGNTSIPRLTMQSYFDKENKQHQKSIRRIEKNERDRELTKPLKNSNQNSINRRSITTSIKSSSNRSFNSNSNSNSNSNTQRNSTISMSISIQENEIQSKKSINTSSSTHSNTHKSNNRNSGIHSRLSVDTFNSISSSINQYETTNITENLDQLNIQSNNSSSNLNTDKSKIHSGLHKSIKSNRLSSSNESKHPSLNKESLDITNNNENNDNSVKSNIKPHVESKNQHHNHHEKKKSISLSTSTSFRSLRNSLSMKSITSSLRNDDNNHNNHNSNISNNEPTTNIIDKRSSLKTKRKMSLDNIRSLLSNRRSSLDMHSEYKNNISLPIMQPETKDKIRNKLRNSNSIMSMSSFVSNNEQSNNVEKSKQINKMKTVDLTQLHNSLLLKLCNQSRCVSFVSYLNKFQTLTPRKHLTKLSETSKNHLFLEFSSQDFDSESSLKPSGVWKVIPIDNDGTPITQVIQELTLTMLMSNKPGFVGINSAKVVSGPIPSSLTDLIGSNIYKDNQLYLIMRLDYAGISLKDFKLESWKDASIILTQILNTLSLAENDNYEHRDLNFENIIINKTIKDVQDINNLNNSIEVTIIDHALARGIVSGQLMYRNLYDADFFKGSGEYRHTIYKLMRRAVNNSKNGNINIPNSTSSMSLNTMQTEISNLNDSNLATDWSQSYKIFNLLWIHYILHIIIFEKGLKPIKMNPILKKKGWLANAGEMGQENAFYERLIQGYRMVEPAVLFGHKKNKYMREINNIQEFKNWYEGN